MKKITFLLFTLLISGLTFGQTPIITAIADGSCTGGNPKLLEVYASGPVDFSLYSLQNQTNANTTWGNTQDLTDLGNVANSFVYITTSGSTDAINSDFPTVASSPQLASNTMNVNGDDRVRIVLSSSLGGDPNDVVVIDQYGVTDTDGSGQSWEYLDSFSKRNNFTSPNGSFNESDWTFGGADFFDGKGVCNNTVSDPNLEDEMGGVATYMPPVTGCDVGFGIATYTCSSNNPGDNNDMVTINIPYTNSNVDITSVTTTSGGIVSGDNPASVANGTITITGLSEGAAWDVILNGGDCDGISTSGTVPAAECDPVPNTCFDLSNGPEQFEIVTVVSNSDPDSEWSNNSGTYSINAFCGGGCSEPADGWLIFGPLDMTGVSDLELAFNAAEGFDGTDLTVSYTSNYSGCPDSSAWTIAQTISGSENASVDLAAASGTDVFIGIRYFADGLNNYSSWTLTNVALNAFGSCPSLGSRPVSDCATCDITLQDENYVCLTNNPGSNNDGVTVEIPYTGLEASITSLSTTSSGTIGGDDPSNVADGTITITGLSEGDAWDLTINGGDCDGTTVSGTIGATICDPTFLVINEIQADPDATNGDANGDGIVDTQEDEFVEIFNSGTDPVDLSDYELWDGFSLRHVFPSGTILAPNTFITVFGGGTPTGIDFISQTASTGSLGLNNSGDDVVLKNAGGNDVVSYTYGSEAGDNQAIGRNPDFTGDFVKHTEIPTNMVLFSPGAKNDGSTLSVDSFTANSFNVYPNPVTDGMVNITSTSNEDIKVTVYDILGKRVLNTQLENNTLNVSNLNTGIYILNINQNGNTTTKKLVIK